MKIKQDLMHITSQPVHDDGTKVEAEEQTVSRIITTDVDADVGGSIAGSIVVSKNVAEFAQQARTTCHLCRHFDNEGFIAFLRKADSPAAPLHVREGVNVMRANLLQTQNANLGAMHAGMDGDMDVEHALGALGFCRALYEVSGDDVVVHPLSSCPPEVIDASRPVGLFSPKDRDSEQIGNAAYDALMHKAAGKVP